MRIHQLTSTLANQIAAGEVVERPASVVKELVENGLDAGAAKIEVEVGNGGLGAIRVRDDGHGIHRDDLALALARHATSKLRTAEELQAIRSLGFRGEALPSIASVARVEIHSRYRDADAAWQLKAEGGTQAGGPVPSAHPVGTTVAVRDLFFNMPGRRKFLRTRNTEFRHLEATFKCVALSRFDVALVLTHDGRAIHRLARADDARQRDRRVAKICGDRFLGHALYVELESGDLRMWGWVGAPAYHRGQGDLQYFLVNGRPVKDGVARHAIRQAYGQSLPAGRQPAYVVNLQIDPAAVDVNVHPTKQEVRFREARLVHDFLRRGVAQAISEADGLPVLGASEWTAERQSGSATPPADVPGASEPPPPGPARRAPSRSAPMPYATRSESARTVSSVHGGLLLAMLDGRMRLIDVSAARRWVLSTRMLEGLERGRVASRPLLLPESVRVGERCANQVEAGQGVLERLGFGVHRIGPVSVSLREVPVPVADYPLGDVDLPGLVRELVTALAQLMAANSSDAERADELLIARRAQVVLDGRMVELVEDDADPATLERLLRDLERAWSAPAPPEGWRVPPGGSTAWVEVAPERLRRFFDELAHER